MEGNVMSYTEWKDKTAVFKQIDVRGVQGNFFQGIKLCNFISWVVVV